MGVATIPGRVLCPGNCPTALQEKMQLFQEEAEHKLEKELGTSTLRAPSLDMAAWPQVEDTLGSTLRWRQPSLLSQLPGDAAARCLESHANVHSLSTLSSTSTLQYTRGLQRGQEGT